MFEYYCCFPEVHNVPNKNFYGNDCLEIICPIGSMFSLNIQKDIF